MSAQVLPFASQTDHVAAWNYYCSLVQEQDSDRALLTNVEHQLKIVRAWRRWFALLPEDPQQ